MVGYPADLQDEESLVNRQETLLLFGHSYINKICALNSQSKCVHPTLVMAGAESTHFKKNFLIIFNEYSGSNSELGPELKQKHINNTLNPGLGLI